MCRAYEIKTRYINQSNALESKKEIASLVKSNMENIIDNEYILEPVNNEAAILYLHLLLEKKVIAIENRVKLEKIKDEYRNFLEDLYKTNDKLVIRYGVSHSYMISEAHNRFVIYEYPKNKYIETYYQMQNEDYIVADGVEISEWILEISELAQKIEAQQVKENNWKNLYNCIFEEKEYTNALDFVNNTINNGIKGLE